MLPYIYLLFAFVLLAKGADFFIDGASNIAKYCRVSPLFIGLTIAAIGTSAPEAAVSVKASLVEADGMALGNVIGSNIANICLAIGISALIKPLFFEDSTIKREIPFMVVISSIMLIFGLHFSFDGMRYSRVEGIIFLVLFLGFVYYLLRMAAKDRKSNLAKIEIHNFSIIKAIFLTLIGGGCIVFGGHLAVKYAVKLATMWGVSEKVIGISIVAFGTSIPEIVTSIVAVVKGKVSIAIGNIVGSNTFNILFVLGLAATINPISTKSKVVIDIVICLAISVIFFVFSKMRKQIGRKYGIVLIASYICYIIYLIGNG